MFEIARQAGSAGVDCKMLLWFTKRHCYYHRLLCHSLVLTVILLVTICTGHSWAKSKDCGAPCLPALLRWSFSEDAAGRFKVLFIIEQPAQQFTCHAELSGSIAKSQPFLVTNIF